jgi:hypothetical protein
VVTSTVPPPAYKPDRCSAFSYDSLGRLTRGPDAHWCAAECDCDANGNPVAAGLTIGGDRPAAKVKWSTIFEMPVLCMMVSQKWHS